MGDIAKESKLVTLLPPQATDVLTGESVGSGSSESLSEGDFSTTTKWSSSTDVNFVDNQAVFTSLLSLVSTDYQWTLSASGTNEYYCEAAAGGDPALSQLSKVYEDASSIPVGTVGTLATGEWAWGDNDTLGYNTVYVRLSDGADPDSKADGFVKISQNSGILTASFTQAKSDLATSLEGDTYYVFSYDQTRALSGSNLNYCRITTGIAVSNTDLSIGTSTTTDQTVVFQTKQEPGDFKIEAEVTTGDTFALDNISLQKAVNIRDQYIGNGMILVHGFATGAVGSDPTITFSNGQTITLNAASLSADQEVIVKEPIKANDGYLRVSSISNGDANLTLGIVAVCEARDTTQLSRSVEIYTDHS